MNCKSENCNAYAMKSSEYCFTHNPKSKKKHLESASKGGLATNKGIIRLEDIDINKPSQIVSLLEDTINRVRLTHDDGSMDLKTANCIGYLANVAIKAIEIADINSRLEFVERVILERKIITQK